MNRTMGSPDQSSEPSAGWPAQRLLASMALVGGILATVPSLLGAQSGGPQSLADVLRQVSRRDGDSQIIAGAARSCLDFPVDEASVSQIRAAGGSSKLITGLRAACYSGAELEVIASQVGSPIVLDGVSAGTTPATLHVLPRAGLRLSVGAGSQQRELSVDVAPFSKVRVEVPLMAPRSAASRVVVDRQSIESRYTVPVSPSLPSRPSQPGLTGPLMTSLLLGGAAYVGASSACSKTATSPSPYGGNYNGKYIPAGATYTATAPSCTIGAGAGVALLSGMFIVSLRNGGYRRSLDAYTTATEQYPVLRANYERALLERQRTIDRLVADEERQYSAAEEENERRRIAAAGPPTITVVRSGETDDLRPPRTGFRNPTAVAVVIGNRAYQRSEVPVVEYADRDAASIRRFLIETFGFREENIIFETNAGLATFQRIFGSSDDYRGQLFGFLAGVQAGSASAPDVFVFYSGHGAPDQSNGGAYLVPSDADPQSVSLTAYPLRQLYANLARLPARSVTVVLDACFSGMSDRGTLLRGSSPLTLRVENPVFASPNAVVLTASTAAQVSGWYDAKRHGLFTYALLEQLSKTFAPGANREPPTARELLAQIGPQVNGISRQFRLREQTPQVFGQAADLPLPFVRR